jgi:hypothetical protein
MLPHNPNCITCGNRTNRFDGEIIEFVDLHTGEVSRTGIMCNSCIERNEGVVKRAKAMMKTAVKKIPKRRK